VVRLLGLGTEWRTGLEGIFCLVLASATPGLLAGSVQAQEAPPPDTTVADTTQPVPDADRVDPLGGPALADSTVAVDSMATIGRVRTDSQEVSPTTTSIDTGLIRRYLPSRPDQSLDLFGRRVSPLLGPQATESKKWSATLDSTRNSYILRGGDRPDGPMRLEKEVYRQKRYRANLRKNWRSLVEQSQNQRGNQQGVGIDMVVPGGRKSAFSTVFGKPEVDLRLNGQANINAGFNYRKSDQQTVATGDNTQITPSFKQDLQLGITGTVGDKLKINVDWDTKSEFNYQNQVKLNYSGYEDEILKNVEAGNVSLQTSSQLISGGQSLFGIKSEFQFGNLELTTIASQQEGQSNTLSIDGGAQETQFDLKPTQYDANRHFFLGYYFRNRWNDAHQDPRTIRTFDGFSEITEVEVWKTTQKTQSNVDDADTRSAVAVVDLGENDTLLDSTDAFTQTTLPSLENDQYADPDLDSLRSGETTVSSYLSSKVENSLTEQNLQAGKFKRLTRGDDYRLHPRLGFISLRQQLQSDEALAIAYKYRTATGAVVQVGDFSGTRGGSSGGINADRLVLKLLRPRNPVAPGESVNPAPWFLQLRNVYRLKGRDFREDSFDLTIEYQDSGSGAKTRLQRVGGSKPLLQLLGLDRVNQNGAATSDNEFDFQRLDQSKGLIYFPYLQPFGERILEAAKEETGSRAAGQPFAFKNLYVKKKANAKKEDTQKNVYHLRGSYSGGSKQFYDLGAFTGLVEGSVEVRTEGGQKLKEGVDYRVDYQGGTVNILNGSYTAAGRKLNISYEQNSLTNLQKKTLLGARANWSLQDRFSLGATVMQLSQKSPVDKFRIGKVPIQNTIWGLNGSMNLEPRWLTQAVDALPLVQTREKSKVSISGEFAQLRPSHTTTDAFQQTVDRVKGSDTDSYASDELSGVAYIDDFGGFENTFSLTNQLGAWQVSAAPDSTANAPGLDGNVPGFGDDRKRTYWRGSLGWYQLNEDIIDKLGEGDTPATKLIDTKEVFPGRDTRGQANTTLRTFDLYFDPWQRGPYNYVGRKSSSPTLADFFRTPTKVWGGITRSLPKVYNDFSVQNVEFVEFIVKVYPQNGTVTDGARLFVNLGTISEDVLPNQEVNTEDGLAISTNKNLSLGADSRLSSGQTNGRIDLRDGKTEDLGLDGLVSYTDEKYNDKILEKNFYDEFVNTTDSLRGAIGQLGLTSAQQERLRAEVSRTLEDPSADDYHNYEDDAYFNEDVFPNGLPLQQRFSRYYAGHELSGFESQNKLAEDVTVRRGVARTPDGENLEGVSGGQVEVNNNYFQYGIPLDKLDELAQTEGGVADYVVSKVGRNKDWYKVRIPVRDPTDKVGNIQNFDNIKSIRLWTTGHAAPVTMRFASLELVGSQWRASEAVATQPVERETIMNKGSGEIRVASINREEDPIYESPDGAVVGQTRTATGSNRKKNEQALLMSVGELGPGQQRGVFKTFGEGIDLLKYSNLRMYTHLHGQSNSSQVKEQLSNNLRLFVRLGDSETGNYYEYVQPLKPGDVPSTSGSQELWPEKYEMNLVLERLNRLKILRNQSGIRKDTTFSSGRREVDLNLDFAPPETKLKIRGTPSLRNVKTVAIGVRHAAKPDASPPPPTLRNFELWLNELRVSGFDERKGWAANANVTLDLADFATIQGGFQRRTDGFGGLSSTLGEREQSDNTSWNVRADINLDAFLPERQGWSIPMTVQVQSNRTVPRFDPNRGDVKVQTVANQFNALSDSALKNRERFDQRFGDDMPAEKIRARLQDSVRTVAETYSVSRTMTTNVSKQGSDSWLLQNTVDAMSLNLSYNNRAARNPQRRTNNKWGWSGSFKYQLDFGQARTVQPLGFLPDLPVLGALSDLAFNYAPRSVSFTSNANRNVNTDQSRPSPQEANQGSVPLRVAFPLQQKQRFNHRRNFSLKYDPFGFLSLSFDTNVNQSLNEVASRSQRNLIIDGENTRDTVLTNIGTAQDTTILENLSGYDLGPEDIGKSAFFEQRPIQRSEIEILRKLLTGGARPRTNKYKQRFSATLSMGWTNQKWLNWIDVRDVNYQSSFGWQNGPKGSAQGAGVNNSLSLRTGVSLRPNKVWERFGFFQRLKKAQRQSDQEGGRERRGGQGESPNEGRGDEGSTAPDSTSENGKGLGLGDVPLPNPVGVLRGLALMVLDIENMSVNYSGNWSARSSNVGTLTADSSSAEVHHSLFDALQGNGPSLGYRFGLERSVGAQSRILKDEFQVTDQLSNRHQLEGRTTLSPSRSFQIDLSWNTEWRRQSNTNFRREDNPDGTTTLQQFATQSGENTASVWGFGSFTSLYEQQVSQLQGNSDGGNSDPFPAGGVALTNASVAEGFRQSFLTGLGSVGERGLPVPMPTWSVRYSGISNWPLLRRVVESASINHSYNAEYQSSFSSNSTAGKEATVTFSGQTYLEPDFRVGSARVNEQFQPLLGVDLTWTGDLQTSVEWSRQTTTLLRTSSNQVEEVETSELSGSVSYQKRGLRIPFFGLGRLENQIQFSLTLSRSSTNERTFELQEALTVARSNDFSVPSQATAPSNSYVTVREQTTRLKVKPELQYRLSDRVTADFVLEYEKFDGKNSQQTSYTRINGAFNFRVNITQN